MLFILLNKKKNPFNQENSVLECWGEVTGNGIMESGQNR